MIIKSFRAQNFRNIEKCSLEFDSSVNLLLGENAQGKTNAVEGIYLFARGKSFRRGDEKDLIRFGEAGFNISIEYEDKNGKNTLEYAVLTLTPCSPPILPERAAITFCGASSAMEMMLIFRAR